MTNLPDDWKPTKAQALAKARIEAWLQRHEGLISLASLTLEQLVQISRTKAMAEWLQDPEFVGWLNDGSAYETRLRATREAVLRKIEEIAFDNTGMVEPKDQLRALGMLAELSGDRGPKAAPPSGGLDPGLMALPDADVERELAETRRRLGKGGSS